MARFGSGSAQVLMHRHPRILSFAAFTASFAALAAFVFWGTWSPDVAPVMPDCPTVHPSRWLEALWRNWLETGRFVPDDAKVLLGGPYVWQELQYAFALYCAALGLAYYCRGRGLPRLASYGAGLLLAFSGYWCTLFSAGHLGWFRWMTYGVFAFGLADRAVRKGKRRHWLLLGACTAWASFYQPDLWLLFALLTGLYLAWCCVRERRLPWKGALLALAAFALIGAPSFCHAIGSDLATRDRQVSEGQKGGGAASDASEHRWTFATNWSLPPSEIAEFAVPRLNGDTSCPLTLTLGARDGRGVRPYTGALGRPKGAPAGNYRQHSLYVGFVTCLLALAGLVFGRRTGEVRFLAAAAVVSCLFSFGRYCEPVYRLVYALPFGDYLRAPVKWHHLTEFCLCALAAHGLGGLLSLPRMNGRLGLWVAGAVVLVGAVDLARIDRLYCAPVDVRRARQMDASMQMSVLRRGDFANPQVADMVKRGRIVSLANYLGNPDLFLVEILTPNGIARPPLPPLSPAAWLSLLSLAATAGLAFLVVREVASDSGAQKGKPK